jgi:glycosyltransferase involved in cell wall biosynthesis
VTAPLVEIVVPVYNGARDLAECLDSLLAQTYASWRATVMDNRSTDGTAAIADDYARRDPRLAVVHWDEFVSQSENYNRALTRVSADAAYVKVLEADNWIAKDAIASAVALAESDPSIGVVSGYALMGRDILGHGVDARTSVFSGREVLERLLADQTYLFGTPTNLLFRASALREVSPWFQPIFYDDADLCLRLLRRFRLGFVHQVLAFIRVDNRGVFSSFAGFDFMPAFTYFAAQDYARELLEPGAAEAAIRRREAIYYGCLARAALGGRSRAYWDWNRKVQAARGDRIRRGPLAKALAREAVDMALNPKSTVERLLRKVPGRS